MNKGFTLLEMLIAITIMSFGIVAIYSLISVTIRTTEQSSKIFIASQLLREGVELVRNKRDGNWLNYDSFDQGLLSCTLGCEMAYDDNILSNYQGRFLRIDNRGFYNYSSGPNSVFKRKITITSNPNYLNVLVEVFWLDNISSAVAENLYDWR